MKKEFILFVISVIAYSVVAFAYAHSTFPSKDVLRMIERRLELIDGKLDRIIERELNQHSPR